MRRAVIGPQRLRRPALAITLLAACCLLPATASAAAMGASASRASGSGASLQLVFPLVAHDAALARYTAAVTTPGSPLYAHYRPIAWLARRFGASAQAESRVTRYLRAAGAAGIRVDATGLFIDARMRSSEADRMFGATERRIDGTRGAIETPRALPAGLRGLVTGVVGLDTQPVAAAADPFRHTGAGAKLLRQSSDAAEPLGLSGVPLAPDASTGAQTGTTQATSGYTPVSGAPSGCAAGVAAGGFTPNQYLTAYDYGPLQATGTLGTGERVALIEIDGYNSGDISTFAKCFGLNVPKIQGFGVGVHRPLPPGGEATLDLEVLTAAAPDLSSIDVYESQPEASDVLMALTSPLQTTGAKPQVISASLGLCESQTEQAVGRAGIDATESALAEAADSGITFLAASGDYGSADCLSSNGQSATPTAELAVNYPASSPYATGVGGTNVVLTSTNTIESQVVWNDGTATTQVGASGGGFSGLFARPSYQTGTVTDAHRAVPDVAMLADVAPGYVVYCSATPDCIDQSETNPWQTVGGTSAATPLLAGGLALIDELLLQHKQDGLGLVNPLLYELGRNPAQAPLVFDSVTTGSNDVGTEIPSDGQPLGCCIAAAGYNEATGWGSVNLDQLAQAAIATEPPIGTASVALPAGQSPIAAKHILATVTCSASCLFTAYARVTIGRQAPFTDNAALAHLPTAGDKTLKIDFSKGQLSRLAVAVKRHTKVSATVTGAIVDPAYDIEYQSPQAHLRIRH